MSQLYFLHFLKEKQILGIGAGISCLYIVNTELVKRPYYLYLIGDGKGNALTLRAVAQRRIVYFCIFHIKALLHQLIYGGQIRLYTRLYYICRKTAAVKAARVASQLENNLAKRVFTL